MPAQVRPQRITGAQILLGRYQMQGGRMLAPVTGSAISFNQGLTMKPMMKAFVAAAAAAALSGCGGDDDDGPRLELAIAVMEAAPASENGVVEPAKAASVSNQALAADASFPEAYCRITFNTVPSTNGKSYLVVVNFRQSDAIPVFVSLADLGATWSVAQTDTTVVGVSDVTVDRIRRTIEYNGASLTGVADATQKAKLTGTIAFPANPANNACG